MAWFEGHLGKRLLSHWSNFWKSMVGVFSIHFPPLLTQIGWKKHIINLVDLDQRGSYRHTICVDDCSFMRHSPGRSPLDWVETICEIAHVMGVLYSSGQSWDNMWSLVVLLWTELRRLEMVSCQTPMDLMDLVELAWDGFPDGTSMDLVELICWEWRPCGWAQVDMSLVAEY